MSKLEKIIIITLATALLTGLLFSLAKDNNQNVKEYVTTIFKK